MWPEFFHKKYLIWFFKNGLTLNDRESGAGKKSFQEENMYMNGKEAEKRKVKNLI